MTSLRMPSPPTPRALPGDRSPGALSPGALVQLVTDPVALAAALPAMQPAALAAACDRMSPASAAHVIAALPADTAARVLDDDALTHPADVVEHLNDRFLGQVIGAIRPERRVAIARAASREERRRLRAHLDPLERQASSRGAAHAPARARLQRWGWPLVAVSLSAIAFASLRHALRDARYHDVMRAAAAVPSGRLLAALLLTVAGYATLTGYDLLALRYVGRAVPVRRTLFASFIASAMSQSAGLASLTGGAVRYRFWSAWGLSTAEVAQGVAFTTATFWAGVLTIGGAALVAGDHAASWPWLASPAARVAGAGMLALVAAYLAWSLSTSRPLELRGWSFPAPRPALAVAQVAIAALDWALAGLVLRVLLPGAMPIATPHFLGLFLVAQVAGLLSHVPGGIGVFEAVMLLLLGTAVPVPVLAGALLLFRAVYYLLPLALAIVAFAGWEVLLRHRRMARAVRLASRWVPSAAPFVLSIATFAAGVVLLVSGATPSLHQRMHLLHGALPLGVLEVSHFTASVVGILLVLLARGMRQRLDAAWHVAVVLLGVGIVASLLKGLDYEEASILALTLAGVAASHRAFHRRAALFADPLTPGWTAAVLLVLGGTAWLGFFSFRHVGYSSDLWWHFALHGDAPRFLRAMVGATACAIAVSTWRLIRPAAAQPAVPTTEELARTRSLIESSAQATANLALLGDKALLFGEQGGFVMYGVEGRSWISLGDPVAATAGERAELAWRFREMARRQGGWPVFYQVSRESLPLYVDLGLTLLKLGESATVPLHDFSLEGPDRRALRRAVRDATKAGCTFEIAPAGAAATLMPELRAVSDAWLAARRVREKGFSLGRFDEQYLMHFPIALVRRAGIVVAFANVWTTGARQELSIDLMRHLPDAPSGTMDFLFAELMLWARDAGYERFDLGMAPLSGFEPRALAPSWNRMARAVFALGEHFYNFQGLRRYKEKFHPVWEPRYLATPGGLHLPRVLANVAALVSGGIAGVVSR